MQVINNEGQRQPDLKIKVDDVDCQIGRIDSDGRVLARVNDDNGTMIFRKLRNHDSIIEEEPRRSKISCDRF